MGQHTCPGNPGRMATLVYCVNYRNGHRYWYQRSI